MLAYDLDGTVVNDVNEVSDASLLALRKVVDRGIAVASISGRNVEKSLEPFAAVPAIQRAAYLGCYNGAMVLSCASDGDGRRQILHEQRLSTDVCLEVGEYIARRDLNVVFCSCAVDGSGVQEVYVADRDSDSVRALAVLVGLDIPIHPGIVDRIRSGETDVPPKLLVLPGAGARDEILAEMRQMLGPRAYLARTGDDRIEVMHPEVNKAFALDAICRAIGSEPEEAVVIGDGDNDLPMLKAAGLGVLMANADEATRSDAAGLGLVTVASQAEDGFSDAVNRFVLGDGGSRGGT